MKRCGWVGKDSIYIDYHDNEWGVPVYDSELLSTFAILRPANSENNQVDSLVKNLT
ncbi:DNA-3-methyladenine glycosylase I [Aliikangiella coralliicola]|uniref:DNA-3-methyladenine glycosylase I n=1 Tax=Aliikangiella coralliicola TaxID=2592383 RepID=A0A545UF98_9GAMM|nr:DNA-3-methyladenine glycosylase I [Aliikangiella coralliicola]TQV88150.1 hypothetical protein FLL46_06375 [Aliikangiella coralliicola]